MYFNSIFFTESKQIILGNKFCYRENKIMNMFFSHTHTIKTTKVIWASSQENQSSGFVNNTGADKPVHPHSLISAFVIHFFESIIGEIYLASLCI